MPPLGLFGGRRQAQPPYVTESINTCVAVCDGEVFVAFVLTSTVTAYNPAGVRLTVGFPTKIPLV